MGPTSGQAGQEVFLLSKLDLESAFVRTCPPSENIQDQGGTIDNFYVE